MSTSCLDCAKFKREIERLQAEVIRLGQQWLELKKFIINQEKKYEHQESSQG